MDRLSPLDASFLHVEDDVNHMHIGSIGIFEGPPPAYEELTATVGGRLALVPRYRQRVATVPLALGRPVWVDDPHFNIEYHIRHTALPAPGGDEELRRLVGRVMSQQLDRTKPLWEIWMVEGLGDDRWAMVSKVHHCLVDGVSGTELLAVILDLTPDVPAPVEDDWQPRPAPSPLRLAATPRSASPPAPTSRCGPSPPPCAGPGGPSTRWRRCSGGRWRCPAWSGPPRPPASTAPSGPTAATRGPARTWPTSSASGPPTGARSTTWCWPSSPGASATCCCPGARTPTAAPSARWSRCRCGPRGDSGPAGGDGTLNNKVSAMFAELPVGIADPVERLHAITAQLQDLKESRQAVAGEALTSAAGFAPPMLLTLGTRIATRAARRTGNLDTVTTNVPGPQFPLYSCGRRLLRATPYVPLAAPLRVGVSIFSYDGELTFGITGDYDTAADIDVLAEGIGTGVKELLTA